MVRAPAGPPPAGLRLVQTVCADVYAGIFVLPNMSAAVAAQHLLKPGYALAAHVHGKDRAPMDTRLRAPPETLTCRTQGVQHPGRDGGAQQVLRERALPQLRGVAVQRGAGRSGGHAAQPRGAARVARAEGVRDQAAGVLIVTHLQAVTRIEAQYSCMGVKKGRRNPLDAANAS